VLSFGGGVHGTYWKGRGGACKRQYTGMLDALLPGPEQGRGLCRVLLAYFAWTPQGYKVDLHPPATSSFTRLPASPNVAPCCLCFGCECAVTFHCAVFVCFTLLPRLLCIAATGLQDPACAVWLPAHLHACAQAHGHAHAQHAGWRVWHAAVQHACGQ
jgi:hypothetical protein